MVRKQCMVRFDGKITGLDFSGSTTKVYPLNTAMEWKEFMLLGERQDTDDSTIGASEEKVILCSICKGDTSKEESSKEDSSSEGSSGGGVKVVVDVL